ncbi:hypothetical protein L1887_36555 [Cichorium endivia]|nr:hypothetical protein L1887_36555 [Cichorium endivia]
MLKYNSNGTMFAINIKDGDQGHLCNLIDIFLKIPSLISLPVSIAGKLSLIRLIVNSDFFGTIENQRQFGVTAVSAF